MQFLNIRNVFFVLVLLKKCACGDPRRYAPNNSKNVGNVIETGLKTQMSRGKDFDDLSANLEATKLKDTVGGHYFGQNPRKHIQAMEKEGQGIEIKKEDEKETKEKPQRGFMQPDNSINGMRDDETTVKGSAADSGNDLQEMTTEIFTKLDFLLRNIPKNDGSSDMMLKTRSKFINPDLIDQNEQVNFNDAYGYLKSLNEKLQKLAEEQNNEYYISVAKSISYVISAANSIYGPFDTSENLEAQ